MLVNLRHYFKRHTGQPRAVAWPRVKVDMSRDAAYGKLVSRGRIFEEGTSNLKSMQPYSLRTATGEIWTGDVKFLVPSRLMRHYEISQRCALLADYRELRRHARCSNLVLYLWSNVC